MSIPIKSAGDAGKKFQERAVASSAYYEQGVKNPGIAWDVATKASEQAYEEGLRNSIQNKSFGKGVTKAGNGKWQKGATEKGVARFGQGISMAQGDYETAVAPFFATIASLTLPPKGAKNSPANYQRAQLVGNALYKKKLEMYK